MHPSGEHLVCGLFKRHMGTLGQKKFPSKKLARYKKKRVICDYLLLNFSINFQATIDFPAFWLVKIRRLWSDSHWPVTIAFCFFFKMVARFAVVSGRSNGRGICENLEKIAIRKRQKSYEIWFIKNLRVNIKLYVLYLKRIGFVNGPRRARNLNYVNKLILKWIFIKLFFFCKYLEIYTKTINRLRFGDYKPIFTLPSAQWI